jgi:hypothetical protein
MFVTGSQTRAAPTGLLWFGYRSDGREPESPPAPRSPFGAKWGPPEPELGKNGER